VAGDLFMPRAIEEARSRALPALVPHVRIELARGGPAAGVIGAALLAAQEQAAASTETQTANEGVI
jgi:hypothetical protein